MYISRLAVTDFRSYSRADIALEQGANVFVGPNGHGKTNLLEAVGYVATLGSHRVANDAPLVRSEADRAVINLSVVRADRELTADIEIAAGKANKARLNRAPVPPRQLLGIVQTVLFAPEDLALIKGDPSVRRNFLDDLLVTRAPRWAGIRSDYERTLKQRNALLKTVGLARRGGSSGDLRTLEVWDGHLARCGAVLWQGRLDLVTRLAPYITKAYALLSDGKGEAQVSYKSSVEADESCKRVGVVSTEVLEAQLLAALARVRAHEVDRGVTLVGPHRDDLNLDLGEHPVKGYASHGESWSYALALRLASYDLLTAEGGEPILLLDDVFAELDSFRRNRLASLVSDAGQLWVTCAVASDLPESLDGARFDVAMGEVRRVI